jgi:hypothetical protein
MTTTGQAIQILTTLEYLGKYGGVPYFGLVLQTGVGDMTGGTLDLATADVKNILEPWMWWDPATITKPTDVQPPKIQLWQATPPSIANPKAPDPKLIETEILAMPKAANGKPFYVDSSIIGQLDKDCSNALPQTNNGGSYLDWSDPASKTNSVTRRDDGRKILPWPGHLAQVTRYPYPIPHLLNLSFFLKVKATKTAFDPDKVIRPLVPPPGDPSAVPYFFVTVSFNAVVSEKINGVATDKTVTYAPDTSNFPLAKDSRLVIPLNNALDRTDKSLAITTRTLPLPLVPAAQIVLADSSDYTAETADWQAHFSSSVASTFDLSARLVDTVRQACDKSNGNNPDPDAVSLRKAVADQFTGFVTAILTAQREIVAYGCQTGPNGKSLLDRLLDAWVTESNDLKSRVFATSFSNVVKNRRQVDLSSPANDVDPFDTWLAWLKSIPAFTGSALLPPSPAGSDSPVAFDATKMTNYKKGQTVIRYGVSFMALLDSPSKPPTDAGSWRCLTPLLPIYDSSKSYKAGDQVLYQEARSKQAVYRAPDAGIAANQTLPGQSGSPWVPISPFKPEIDVAGLPDRLLAVEHLQLQFAQPDILTQILLAQWTSVFNPSSPTWTTTEKGQFQSFLNSASANLAVWDVRGLLLQCHLDGSPTGSWTTITKSTSTRSSLRAAIQNELDSRLVDGLLKKLPSAPGTPPDFTDQLKRQVDSWLTPRLLLIVPDYVPSVVNARGTPPVIQPTRSAQGLSVMVGTLDANGMKSDSSDPLRSIAGYCVLMRAVGAKDWRCLNAGIPIASADPPKDATKPTFAIHYPDEKPDDLPEPVVIPLPLHNQDGLRRAILTYDNQPLMSSSPAHAFGAGLVPAPKRDADRNFDRMISFQHPSVTRELAKSDASLERWKIPGLAFKQSYEFLLGAVSNSGALPPELADPNNPGLFSFTSLLKQKKLAVTISQISYLRTVPVGDLHFASDYFNPQGGKPKSARFAGGVSFAKLNLPPIPADVQPRASEVYTSSLAPVPAVNGQKQPQPPVGSAPGKPSIPLIVLSPYTTDNQVSEFDLWISKPTTDFLTWDRTQAAIAGTHQARQWAWQLFNTNARNQNSNFDLSLEDPAIDSLTISVINESNIPEKPEKVVGPIKWPDASIPDPASNSNALQSGREPILLKFVTDTNYGSIDLVSPPSGAPPVYTLKLPPGYLRKVSLTVNLKPGANKQFANGISSTPTPYDLLVETASSAFPQPTDLRNALSIQPPVAAADPVTFTLVGQPGQAWKQISRVDLQAQLWRWDGRPARSFPFDQVTPIKYYGGSPAVEPSTPLPVPPAQQVTPPLLQWELETFATRTASDSTTRPMVRQDNNFVANEDRGTELGATYYRAGVTAYNRYGSLVPPEARSAASLNSFASIPGADGDWTRRFIPGRYTLDGSKPDSYKPPKPAIKYIVPLTSAYGGSQQAAASVLVVVQGPWFAIAGLAEDISVKIVDVDPKNHPDGNNWKEAGPDPIYYHSSSQPLPTSYDSYDSPFNPPDPTKDPKKKLLFHGPVGHTFDSSDTNSLWVSSSFVLDPPREHFQSTPPDGQEATQEGTFAQIQFARIIRAAGMVVADPTVTPPKHVQGTPALMPATQAPKASPAIDIPSDYTDPVWVQFLPSRYLPLNTTQDFDTLVVEYDRKSTVAIYDARNDSSKPVTLTHNLHPDPISNPSDYRFALLLTQEVPDLLGRRGQERFVDMLLQENFKNSATAAWNYTPKPEVNPNSLIARIVVIQRQINTSKNSSVCKDPKNPSCDVPDANHLWPELFPADPTQDAISRIVAVSPPIVGYDPRALPQSCRTDPSTQTNATGGD